MPDSSSTWRGSFLVLLAASSFATLGTTTNLAYTAGMSPYGLIMARSLLGAGAVGLLLLFLRRWHDLGQIPGSERATIVRISITAALTMAALTIAFGRLPVALVIIIFYLYPGLVVATEMVRGDEPWRPTSVAGVLLGLAGLVVALGPTLSGPLPFDMPGLLLALAAAVGQAAFLLFSRRPTPSVSGEQVAAIAIASGVVVAIPLALATGTAASLLSWMALPAAWPLALAAGLLGAAVPVIALIAGVRRIGGTRTGMLMLLEPIAGVLIAAVVLGQPLGISIVAGVALVAAGAGLVIWGQARAAS